MGGLHYFAFDYVVVFNSNCRFMIKLSTFSGVLYYLTVLETTEQDFISLYVIS